MRSLAGLLAAVGLSGPGRDSRRLGFAAVLIPFGIWVAVVLWGVSSHEIWKDEGRALMLALSAPNILGVPAAVQGEGHPALWYLLLSAAHLVWPHKSVLTMVSFLVAAAAVLLLLLRAPLPYGWKLLIAFGGLAVFEYSVMARNYGISMLCMFALAPLLSDRASSPVAVGGLLFVLAQTNVHSALLVPFLAGVWIWRRWSAPDGLSVQIDRPAVITVVFVFAGLLAAVLTVYPPRHTSVITSVSESYFRQAPLLKSLAVVLLEPGHFFRLISRLPSGWSNALLFAAALGLIRWPILFLAAMGGLWASAFLFAFVYIGGYRHQGVWLVYLIALYWVGSGWDRASPPSRPHALQEVFRHLGAVAMTVLLLINVWIGAGKLAEDLASELSKSRALGHLIASTPALAQAIIVGEPDEVVEAIGYYVDNPTYLLREHRYGTFATWSSAQQQDMSLGEILSAMQVLKGRTGRPVILAVEFPIDVTADADLEGTWGRRFRYSRQEVRDFLAATRKLPLGERAVGEHFEAYVLE